MSELEQRTDRRGFLEGAAALGMAGGLVAGYGTFFAYAGRFLFPASDVPKAWMFVAEADSIPLGGSLRYTTPAGARVVIARLDSRGTSADFLALSSTCPHLGCQVHWEAVHNRFFCPCHNGVFDAQGKGIGGPPGDAGQSLPRYSLKLERGLLYIEVPLARLADAGEGSGGHDPCLRQA
jgi:nitrite reductase/ring-hydroxylating ferredoxin subunit